jgi:glycosyltransferase involved in cell wall biosynthesis
VIAERLSRENDVSLIVGEPYPASQLESYFAVDFSRVRLVPLQLPVENILRGWSRSAYAPQAARARFDLIRARLRDVLEPRYSSQIQALGLDLLINKNPRSILPCPAPRGVYLCMFPRDMKGQLRPDPTSGLWERAYAALGNRVAGMTEEVLNSYQVIAANSSYTAEWIGRMWRRKSTVVYSSCEDMGPPAPKEKIILHVGRFLPAWRNDYKHQGTLLDLYRGMTALHQQGWQLHFAGTLQPGIAGERRLAELTRAAQGSPVKFHPSVSFDELRNLYRRASIYWHATGYGSSPELHPRRQEHFGMTIVEAMSAGAVPVARNTGGPRETVQHEVSGFLWNNLEELQQYTALLAADPVLLQRLSARAVASVARFHRIAFEERIEALAESLLGRNA